jgi:hypothetical protein
VEESLRGPGRTEGDPLTQQNPGAAKLGWGEEGKLLVCLHRWPCSLIHVGREGCSHFPPPRPHGQGERREPLTEQLKAGGKTGCSAVTTGGAFF